MICPDSHKHATTSNCYDSHKCRCTPCRDANSYRARNTRRLKAYGTWAGSLVPATGTRRRVEGLQLLGFTLEQIGDAADINRNSVWRTLTENTVEPKTRDRIARACKTLMRNPEGGASSRTARQSARKGYVPLVAWDDIDNDTEPPPAENDRSVDEIAIELALTGTRTKLTRDERRQAVKQAHQLRWSDRRTAKHLGCDEQTIIRDRKTLGLEAWAFEQLVKADAA